MEPEKAVKSEGGFLLAKVHQASGRAFDALLKEHGVEFNSAQGRILFVLWQRDGIPIKTLSEKTMLEKSTLTAMLERLRGQGHVALEPDPGDGRVTLVRLTEKNKRLKERYEKVSDEMIGLWYRGFTAEEIEGFEAYLRRILANLSDRRGATSRGAA